MTERLRVVVSGLIAQYPLGGVAWDYLQYVLGLARLGHDVFYLEDTGQWPYNPREGGLAKRPDDNVRYLAGVMDRFGLADRWAYRFPWESQWFGTSDGRRAEIVRTADLLVNVSGTLARPEEYRGVERLVYIDSDPVFTQVKLARGQQDFRNLIDAHDVHLTFGESLDDRVPATGHTWLPTRQPIVLSEWRPRPPTRRVFTTVMNWTSHNSVTYEGETYGQKDVEFRRFLELPEKVAPTVIEIAVNLGKTRRTPRELLAHKGWRLVDPAQVCPDVDGYRTYIESSFAEWSVAKNAYVKGRPGWFSCRSACYLAAGNPVVVEDTGVADVLPVGQGILLFSTLEQAAEAIREVEADHTRHSTAARAIAEEYFASDRVLGRLLEDAFTAGSVGRDGS